METINVRQRPRKVITIANSSDTPKRGRGRPRASLACVSCRSRKVKCDVQVLPAGASCTPCHSSKTRCVVDRRDERRRDHIRGSFDRLQGRLEKLEALLGNGDKSHKQAEVPNDLSEQISGAGNVADILLPEISTIATDNSHRSSLGLDLARAVHNDEDIMQPGEHPDSSDPVLNPRLSPFSADHVTAVYAAKESDAPPGVEADSNLGLQRGLIRHQLDLDSESVESIRHEVDRFNSLQLMTSTNAGTTDEELAVESTEDTVACLDLDQAGGQPRYYGPASRLYIHESAQAGQPSTGISLEPEMESDLVIDIDSPQLQNQLLFLFWHVQVLPAAVVDESLFRQGRAMGGRTQYYSDFLENALLACASRASTSSTLRALGEKYIARAKSGIAQEIERPNLASLQGFLLLSDFEATQGRERAGWIYCGTACRLLLDLGLHEDCSKLVKLGRLTAEDARMRQHTFLVTFIFENFWKLYLGRPSAIPETSLAAVQNSNSRTKMNPSVEAYVSLCVQVSSVTDFINIPASLSSISDLKVRIRDLDALIQTCYDDLPTSLKNHGPNSSEMEPAAYGINMQFCGIRIVLHRILSRLEGGRSRNNTMRGFDEVDEDLASSNGIIYNNAVQISKLIGAYRKIFGVDCVATIMLDNMYVAAQALIHQVTWLERHSSPHVTPIQPLRVLADTLKDVVEHYPVVARMRSSLARLAERTTSLRGMFGPHLERQPEQPTAPLTDDFCLGFGTWGNVNSYLGFDLSPSNEMDVDALFCG